MDKFAWGALFNGGFALLVVLAGIFFVFGNRRREAVLQSLVDAPLLSNLLPESGSDRRKLKMSLILLALFFGVLALMDPLYDYTWVTEKRKGVDLLVALDVSKSMYAKDVSPSRFERSKLEILNLAEQLQGDRVGLIVFTGVARTQCPLTLDYEAFKLITSEMEIGVLSQGGTSLASALEQAIQSFDKQYKKERILILVTDGESLDPGWEKYLEPLKQVNIRVFTVGLGSKSGTPILLPSENGQKEYVKDQSGNIVLSKLDEESLKKLALTTGGAYVQAEMAGFNLEKLYREKIAPLEGRELESKRQKRYEHRFYIPLAFALFFLLLEMGLREWPSPHRKTLPLAILLFLMISVTQSKAEDPLKEGEKAFKAGDYQKAELAYQEAGLRQPNSPELAFNQGTVLYRENKFENAAALFQKALYSTDPEVEAKAHYNLGNTYYRLGKLEQSVQSYEKSLNLNPKQPDCQQNLEFVQSKIKELLDKKEKQKEGKPKEGEKGQPNTPAQESEKAEPAEEAKVVDKKEVQEPKKEKRKDGQPGDKYEQENPNPDQKDPNLVKKKDQTEPDSKLVQKDDKNKDSKQKKMEDKDSKSPTQSKDDKKEQTSRDDKGKLSSKEMKELESQDKDADGETKVEEKEGGDTPGRLTKEEAERILQSLEDRERQKRKQQNTPPQNEGSSGTPYYKDW